MLSRKPILRPIAFGTGVFCVLLMISVFAGIGCAFPSQPPAQSTNRSEGSCKQTIDALRHDFGVAANATQASDWAIADKWANSLQTVPADLSVNASLNKLRVATHLDEWIGRLSGSEGEQLLEGLREMGSDFDAYQLYWRRNALGVMTKRLAILLASSVHERWASGGQVKACEVRSSEVIAELVLFDPTLDGRLMAEPAARQLLYTLLLGIERGCISGGELLRSLQYANAHPWDDSLSLFIKWASRFDAEQMERAKPNDGAEGSKYVEASEHLRDYYRELSSLRKQLPPWSKETIDRLQRDLDEWKLNEWLDDGLSCPPSTIAASRVLAGLFESVRLSLGVLLYLDEYHRWPTKSMDIAKYFDGNVPVDPSCGLPFVLPVHNGHEPADEFRFYAVGSDGEDNGGSAVPSSSQWRCFDLRAPRGSDFVVTVRRRSGN